MRVLEACLHIITEASAELAELVKDYASLSAAQQQPQGELSLLLSAASDAASQKPSPRHPPASTALAKRLPDAGKDSATTHRFPAVVAETSSAASRAAERLTSALRSVSGLLTPSVLGSAALWSQVF
jgi:ABC-type transporter Mla subunit MlaD